MSAVECRIVGRAGRVTLNRPDALNALTHDMCLEIENALIDWRMNRDVHHVVVDGAGARAFCAGGDVTRLYEAGRRGDSAFTRRFWRDEYRLNDLIDSYPKPYVAIMHGFVMGGGVGVSAHGSHRIVCESTRVAMPECSIGLVPDVGGSLLLARARGRLGEFLGASGYRMEAGDAIHAGFADSHIAEKRLPELVARLCEGEDADDVVKSLESAPGQSNLARHQDLIDSVFTSRDAAANWQAGVKSAGLRKAFAGIQDRLRAASPLSLVVAGRILGLVREEPTMATALNLEYRFVSRCMEASDFLEGIRAAVIDRDRSPAWKYATPGKVPARAVDALLAPVTGK